MLFQLYLKKQESLKDSEPTRARSAFMEINHTEKYRRDWKE